MAIAIDDFRSVLVAAAGAVRANGRQPAARFGRRLCLGLLVASLAACGGGGGGGGGDLGSACKPGLLSGFGGTIGDEPLRAIADQLGGVEGSGSSGGDGSGAGGSVGGGEGNGIGGDDGQYRRVHVTVETANGRVFGPWLIDDAKGMVTYVHCGLPLPAKVTFEGKAADAIYYDEGLGREVSFTGKQRIGLISRYDINVGVTPLTQALYERAMAIGRARSVAEGWKDPAIVEQAHAELLAAVNDQLPGLYRLTDLRRLPVMLNAANDRADSNALTVNQNGLYGALLAGLAKAGATALPGSGEPALDVARTLIADLVDTRLDLVGAGGALSATDGRLPYTYDTLWSSATVGTGVTAVKNGTGSLRTDAVPIGYVRSKAAPGAAAGSIAETEYVLASNGNLVANLNPASGGGSPRKPAATLAFSQLYRFGAGPVVALRRDGLGLLVFPTPADGTSAFEVPTADTRVNIVELFDGGFPALRLSDGAIRRLEGNALVDAGVPAGLVNFSCRAEIPGALAAGDDAALGAAAGTVCYGLTPAGVPKVFRPGGGAAGRNLATARLTQVSGNTQLVVGLLADGGLLRLDADHAVRYRNAAGVEVTGAVGGATRELIAPSAGPVPIAAPKICWLRVPFAIGCDGAAYRIDYAEYLGADGDPVGSGAVSGLSRLPIPEPVWRTRANRSFAGTGAGLDAVFIGVNGRAYDINGQVLNLPLDGTPLDRTSQAPLAPVIAPVAGDNVVTRAESQAGLVVAGTAQAGSRVDVTLGSASRSTTADAQGNWQVTFAPAELPSSDGEIVLQAIAANAIGPSSPARLGVRFSVGLPPAPTIGAVTGDDVVTRTEAAQGVTISGSAIAGATVSLSWGSATRAANLGSSTTWSFNIGPGELPPPGQSTVTVSAANANGPGPAATRTVTIQPPPPGAPTIGTVAGDNIVTVAERANGVTISGAAATGATIAVDWQGVAKSTQAIPPASGGGATVGWSVSFGPNEVPAPGRTTVTVTAANAGGTSSAATLAVEVLGPPPAPPTIAPVTGDNVVTAVERGRGVTISGTAVAGASISVSWQGSAKTAQAVPPASSNGTIGGWSVTFAPAEVPAAGQTTVTATASNANGPSAPATLAVTVQPALAVTLDAVSVDDVFNLGEARSGITATGTTTAGSSVALSWRSLVAGNNDLRVPASRSVTAGSDGRFSVTYKGEEFDVGQFEFQAQATNPAAGSATTARRITIQPAPSVILLGQSPSR